MSDGDRKSDRDGTTSAEARGETERPPEAAARDGAARDGAGERSGKRSGERKGEAALMQQALDLAVENVQSGLGGPFAALVVEDGRVLAQGTNRVTTTHDPTAHAEVVAIRAACRERGDFSLDGCTLISTCEPCPMCLGAVYWARLDRVLYAATRADAAEAGFDDAHIYEEIDKPPSGRQLPMQQIEAGDAGRPFSAWEAFEGREEY